MFVRLELYTNHAWFIARLWKFSAIAIAFMLVRAHKWNAVFKHNQKHTNLCLPTILTTSPLFSIRLCFALLSPDKLLISRMKVRAAKKIIWLLNLLFTFLSNPFFFFFFFAFPTGTLERVVMLHSCSECKKYPSTAHKTKQK